MKAIPWEQRERWHDIRPIVQDDGDRPLVPIAYHAEYRNAMDAFRYLASINERSARGVELSEAIVRMNPAHYSVWAFRSECLLASGADLNKELDLMDELVKVHLKSYQVWQHRRTVVLALDDPSREMGFVAKALAIDSKNYHTWAYRQWVLCRFWGRDSIRSDVAAVWDNELRFIDSMLASDIRNNSAWNHRFFVVFERDDTSPGAGAVNEELRYTEGKLRLAPNNASAWNYLRGVLKRSQRDLVTVKPLADALARIQPPSVLALEFMADALLETAATDATARAEATKLFDALRTDHDPIRAAYWQHRSAQVSVTA